MDCIGAQSPRRVSKGSDDLDPGHGDAVAGVPQLLEAMLLILLRVLQSYSATGRFEFGMVLSFHSSLLPNVNAGRLRALCKAFRRFRLPLNRFAQVPHYKSIV